MLAYRLRHRVTIQYQAEAQDTNTGAVTTSWVNLYAGVPAEVLTGMGREFQQSASTQAEIAARINMRWFPGLTESMRILWDGKVFNIHAIETDATARREYRLKCTAGVNDG